MRNRTALIVVLGLFAGLVHAQPLAKLEDQFRDPPLASKSRPLWFWNKVNPTTAEIVEQMRRCRDESGYYGFGILPCVGPEKYLTEEYFARYGDALRTAKELGMKMCLYDEYWFPSGSAGGQFKKRFPELCMKALAMKAQEVRGPGQVKMPLPEGTLMAAVAMESASKRRIDLTDKVAGRELAAELPEGEWKVMLFVCVKTDQPLMDYLSAEAVKKFLEITHEQYFKRFPEHFGTTIDSVFYDEPPLYRVNTWTEGFNAKFQAKFGRSPALDYPALWMDIGPETAAARNAFFGLRAELFATEYIKTMDDWCRAHKVQLTGHMDQEQVQNPTCISGDLLKSFKHQAIPGIDEIFSFGRTQRAYKLISSSAYNWDKPLVMSETYGAIKNMPVEMLYRMCMDEYAKGINLLVPHAVWLDADPRRVTFEPELSYRHARYGPALAEFNKYVGRLNLLLQGGRHVSDIAVLYPIATLHAGYQFGAGKPYEGGLHVPEADYLEVGERLSLEVRRDFTYLHPEVLDERCIIKDRQLRLDNKVNFEQYRVLILPGMRVMHASNAAKVRQFYDTGGTVIATTQLPYQSAEKGQDSAVCEAMRHVFGIDPKPAAASKVKATASSTFGPGFEPEKAADGSAQTRWNSSDKATGEQWLELDLGRPTSVERIAIREAFDRVSKYSIQAWDEKRSAWTTLVQGETIGTRQMRAVKPFTTPRVRLVVHEYRTNCLAIAEFAVNPTGPEKTTQTNRAGGRAIFLPEPDAEALKAAMDPEGGAYDVDVDFSDKPVVKNGNLTYIHKVHEGRDIWFFANSSETPVNTWVGLRGRWSLEQWDPYTGKQAELEADPCCNGTMWFSLKLPPFRSVFIVGKPL